METLPREKLAEIITQYGRSVCDDPRRCEALLKDLCGQNKREISALMGALRERAPAELLTADPALPRPALIARLAGRLSNDLAFTDEAARWAVESWALALGVVTPADIAAARPSPPPSMPPAPPADARPAAPVVPNRGPVQNWPRPNPAPAPLPAPDPVGHGLYTLRSLGGLLLGALGLFLFGMRIYRALHFGGMQPVSPSPDIPRVTIPPYVPISSTPKEKMFAGAPAWQTFEADSALNDPALSRDNHTLAAAVGKHLQVWDAATKTRLHDLAVGSKNVRAVAFSPDGKTVATGAEDSNIKLWDAQAGNLLHTLKAPTATVYSTSIGMNGVTNSVYQENAKAGRALAFTHDGATLATDGGNDGTILLWDVHTGRLKRKVEAHFEYSALHFSPDDSLLVGLDGSGGAHVWDARRMRLLRKIDPGGTQRAHAFAPNGQTLALAPDNGGSIKFWDVQTGKVTRSVQTDLAWIQTLAFLPDGKSLLAGGNSNLRLIDALSGKTLRQYNGGPRQPRQIALSPDGTTVAAVGNKDEGIVNAYVDDGGKTVGVWKTQP